MVSTIYIRCLRTLHRLRPSLPSLSCLHSLHCLPTLHCLPSRDSGRMDGIKIRAATKEDVPGIRWLTQLLAEYEKEPYALKLTEEELLRDGFGEEKYFFCLLAELTAPPPAVDRANTQVSQTGGCEVLPSQKMKKDERLVGHAFYFYTYSTTVGKVLYLEDLFVRTEYRNRGIGTALMRECAKIAVSKQCARMQWQVLDWNVKAQQLYDRIGGKCQHNLLPARMDRTAIATLASGSLTDKMEGIEIRPALREDVSGIHSLSQLLREFDKDPHTLSEEEFLRAGFSEVKSYHCLLAELTSSPLPAVDETSAKVSQEGGYEELPSQKMKKDEKLVAYVLYFYTYSTWEGRVLFFEDLFVRAEYRNSGIGRALMRECAKIAVSRQCVRMQWEVFDWNVKALRFYDGIGGKCTREWLPIRMNRTALTAFASGETDIEN